MACRESCTPRFLSGWRYCSQIYVGACIQASTLWKTGLRYSKRNRFHPLPITLVALYPEKELFPRPYHQCAYSSKPASIPTQQTLAKLYALEAPSGRSPLPMASELAHDSSSVWDRNEFLLTIGWNHTQRCTPRHTPRSCASLHRGAGLWGATDVWRSSSFLFRCRPIFLCFPFFKKDFLILAVPFLSQDSTWAAERFCFFPPSNWRVGICSTNTSKNRSGFDFRLWKHPLEKSVESCCFWREPLRVLVMSCSEEVLQGVQVPGGRTVVFLCE